VADCSRGGLQPPEMHDDQQWTAIYCYRLNKNVIIRQQLRNIL